MLYRLRSTIQEYPRQFWYLLAGLLVSTSGMGMIWPFLTIYLRQHLNISMTTVTALLMLDSIMSILSSFVAGAIADRFGRKWALVVSLGMVGLVYLVMSRADTLWMAAVLMGLRGVFMPLYRIGSDAMVADLIPDEKRVDAYSLLRAVNNVGIAVGPSVGGFVAAVSYTHSFYIAAGCLVFFSLFALIFMRETAPHLQKVDTQLTIGLQHTEVGYATAFKDKLLMSVVLASTFVGMASSLIFVLLPAYAKENFAMTESQTGFIMAVNAGMVIFFQIGVTRLTRRQAPLWMCALGAGLYAIGIGSVALGHGFWAFAASMVVVSLGELVLVPTATTLIANLAPPAMRARYMSVYGQSWSISHGFGPVVGGFLNDQLAPRAMWLGGLGWGTIAFVLFTALARRRSAKAVNSLKTDIK